MSTPTFFLVGAPKAGTTSLFEYLGAHPEIAVAAIKEPCFFAPEVPVDPETDAHRRDWASYLALFSGAGAARAIGEGSVAYLSSVNAATAIRARIPHAKVLMMLRDPADRLFAHYSAARVAGVTSRPFAEWVAEQQRVEAARTPIYGAVWAGRYATHLARFQAAFPADQLHISDYDDFVADPDAVLAAIFAFLGVDSSVTIDRSARHNVTTVSKWPALDPIRAPLSALLQQMLPADVFDRARAWSREPFHLTATADDRAHGIALYREEIESLSRVTGRDLSRWFRA
jgi:hypothetical protein